MRRRLLTVPSPSYLIHRRYKALPNQPDSLTLQILAVSHNFTTQKQQNSESSRGKDFKEHQPQINLLPLIRSDSSIRSKQSVKYNRKRLNPKVISHRRVKNQYSDTFIRVQAVDIRIDEAKGKSYLRKIIQNRARVVYSWERGN